MYCIIICFSKLKQEISIAYALYRDWISSHGLKASGLFSVSYCLRIYFFLKSSFEKKNVPSKSNAPKQTTFEKQRTL